MTLSVSIGPEVGQGAFGKVYRGSTRDNRLVAVKRPRSLDAADQLVNEARALAKIDHPNVVRYLDLVPVENDGWHLVMEYVDGVSLAQLRISELPCSAAVHIARSLLAALSALHEQQIIHRDVSPSNIMISYDGRVILTDLGLARSPDDLTDIAGTPRYMAPEQFGRERLDGCVDQYAVGVILWELLTNRQYGAAVDEHEMVLRKMTEEGRPTTPVRSFNPGIPASLDMATQQLMAHSATDRFPSAREAMKALPDLSEIGAVDLANSAQRFRAQRSRRTAERPRWRWLVLPIGIAFAGGIALGANLISGTISEPVQGEIDAIIDMESDSLDYKECEPSFEPQPTMVEKPSPKPVHANKRNYRSKSEFSQGTSLPPLRHGDDGP